MKQGPHSPHIPGPRAPPASEASTCLSSELLSSQAPTTASPISGPSRIPAHEGRDESTGLVTAPPVSSMNGRTPAATHLVLTENHTCRGPGPLWHCLWGLDLRNPRTSPLSSPFCTPSKTQPPFGVHLCSCLSSGLWVFPKAQGGGVQGMMSMLSAAELPDSLLWFKSLNRADSPGRQHVKKRLGQETVVLTLFSSLFSLTHLLFPTHPVAVGWPQMTSGAHRPGHSHAATAVRGTVAAHASIRGSGSKASPRFQNCDHGAGGPPLAQDQRALGKLGQGQAQVPDLRSGQRG